MGLTEEAQSWWDQHGEEWTSALDTLATLENDLPAGDAFREEVRTLHSLLRSTLLVDALTAMETQDVDLFKRLDRLHRGLRFLAYHLLDAQTEAGVTPERLRIRHSVQVRSLTEIAELILGTLKDLGRG